MISLSQRNMYDSGLSGAELEEMVTEGVSLGFTRFQRGREEVEGPETPRDCW
jgi:hypothetical protein